MLTFLFRNTKVPPFISRALLDGSKQETCIFDFRPLCDCLAFCRWPCRTASVVPMIDGQAAIDVRMPKTIADKV